MFVGCLISLPGGKNESPGNASFSVLLAERGGITRCARDPGGGLHPKKWITLAAQSRFLMEFDFGKTLSRELEGCKKEINYC